MLQHPTMTVPVPAALPVTTRQPFLPRTRDEVIKRRQRLGVSGDPVVVVVPLNFDPQYVVLFFDLLVTVPTTPRGDLPDRPALPVRGRLSFHHPATLPGKSPVMGKTQKVERVGLVPMLPATAFRPRTEADQSRLVRVNRQTMLREPLREQFQNPAGVRLAGEAQNKIIRKADQEHTASQLRLHLLLDPFIQHIVQINVCEQRGDHAANNLANWPR